jgi:uncharacterized protein
VAPARLHPRHSTLYFHFLWILLFLAIASILAALEVPPLRGRVNDFAGLISRERAHALETRLKQFEAETGHQIAVLTIPTLEGEDIEGFGIRVAEAWKIGQKGFDNGAILIVAKDDKKLRIEVGYGLEGVLPDALASRIIREVIVPRFRNNDFAGGIEAGTETIMKTTRGEPLPPRQRSNPPGTDLSVAQLLFILFLIAIPLIAIWGTRKQSRSLGTWTGSGRRRHDYGGGTFWGSPGGGGFGGGGGFSGGGGGFGGGGASGSW